MKKMQRMYELKKKSYENNRRKSNRSRNTKSIQV